MHVLAPAKINLHLRVGRRRADGFHPLMSWMATVGLFDKLTFERARPPAVVYRPGISFSCDRPDVPADPSNLVVKAANALIAATEGSRPTLSALAANPSSDEAGDLSAAIRLEKRIPVGAGLGGGSSDAARTLLALNRLWGLSVPTAKLEGIAATLGSDLSFFFHPPSAVCSGRGEIVRAIPVPRPSHGVLILPEFAMGTPGVYRRFDELGLGVSDLDAESPDWTEWSGFDSQRLLPKLVNDLEAPAFSLEPKLGLLRDEAERRVNRVVRMSGSGSSLFTLYDDGKEAEEASEKLNSDLSNVHAISVELAPQLRDDLHENLGATKQ